jgi:hypothetical protein
MRLSRTETRLQYCAQVFLSGQIILALLHDGALQLVEHLVLGLGQRAQICLREWRFVDPQLSRLFRPIYAVVLR